MLNSGFKLFFLINDTPYHGATLRVTHEKVELFYHFPWGSKQETKVLDLDRERSDQGFLPDHISFHNNGTIHAKARDHLKKKIYHNPLNAGQNVFDLERAHFLPILLNSIDISKPSFIEKRFNKITSTNEISGPIWDLSNLNSFSIIVISKCARLNPNTLVADHGFQNLKRIGSSAIMMDPFTFQNKRNITPNPKTEFNTEIIIMVVENVWDELPPQNNVSSDMFSCTVTLPPMNRIGQLPNNNHR